MNDTVTIAVASGKGGVGKTMIAANLAATAEGPVCLLDCDVEAPNAHLFVNPEWTAAIVATVSVPRLKDDRCDGCGRCRAACRFNAIAIVERPMFFHELCHSCGACVAACKSNAIYEVRRKIGTVESGTSGSMGFIHGRLDTGEAKSPPLIERVREFTPQNGLVFIDSPPGTACPAVAAVKHVDLCLLVAEPTPFGMHDLEAAVRMVSAMGIKAAVVVNRSDIGDDRVRRYCAGKSIPIIAEIPFDRSLAESYSRGEMISGSLPRYGGVFRSILENVLEEAAG